MARKARVSEPNPRAQRISVDSALMRVAGRAIYGKSTNDSNAGFNSPQLIFRHAGTCGRIEDLASYSFQRGGLTLTFLLASNRGILVLTGPNGARTLAHHVRTRPDA